MSDSECDSIEFSEHSESSSNSEGHKKSRKPSIRNKIFGDLEKYDIPYKVREKVYELSKRLKLKNRKGKPKRMLYYFYITASYAELGWFCDSRDIMKRLKITQKDVNRSENEYSELQIGYAPPTLKELPENFIRFYLDNLNVTHDHLDEIVNYYNSQAKKSKNLSEYFPQDLYLAIVIKYLNDLGYNNFTTKKLCEKFERKFSKVNNIVKLLEKLENN